jgi:DNA-binding response OmpR family regulator
MRILVADDDPVSQRLLRKLLTGWGHEVVLVGDGLAALETLRQPDAPRLAILDWVMPELEGVEVCRRVREAGSDQPPYLILLTAQDQREKVLAGLRAGANDYITKPFDPEELHARLNIGERMVELQRKLAERVGELEAALAHVRRLQGILPICSYCKKVRNDQNYWQQVETYFGEHAAVMFTHGICPDCLRQAMADMHRPLG